MIHQAWDRSVNREDTKRERMSVLLALSCCSSTLGITTRRRIQQNNERLIKRAAGMMNADVCRQVLGEDETARRLMATGRETADGWQRPMRMHVDFVP